MSSSAAMKLLATVFLLCAHSFGAELLQEAFQEFPANTTSLEYDNLKSLRQLPSYPELRKQYSGEALNRVKQTLLALGIPEEQLSQVVTASGPAGFFGLLEGAFGTEPTANKRVLAQQFSIKALGADRVFCSHQDVCVLFRPEKFGSAIFGSFQQLRAIADVRNAQSAALTGNSSYASLLHKADLTAPVIGFAPGSEIGEMMKEIAPPALISRFDLTQWFSSVDKFSYTVRVQNLAHLAVNLLCKSETQSGLLSGVLNAAGTLQRVTGVGSTPQASVESISASSSGRFVFLKVDAKLTP